MGERVASLTDNQILDLIQQTNTLVDVLLDISLKEINEQKKRGIKHPNPDY